MGSQTSGPIPGDENPPKWGFFGHPNFEAFYRHRQAADAKAAGTTDPLILSVDGKGIVMRTEGLREATRKAALQDDRKDKARLAPGEKYSGPRN